MRASPLLGASLLGASLLGGLLLAGALLVASCGPTLAPDSPGAPAKQAQRDAAPSAQPQPPAATSSAAVASVEADAAGPTLVPQHALQIERVCSAGAPGERALLLGIVARPGELRCRLSTQHGLSRLQLLGESTRDAELDTECRDCAPRTLRCELPQPLRPAADLLAVGPLLFQLETDEHGALPAGYCAHAATHALEPRRYSVVALARVTDVLSDCTGVGASEYTLTVERVLRGPELHTVGLTHRDLTPRPPGPGGLALLAGEANVPARARPASARRCLPSLPASEVSVQQLLPIPEALTQAVVEQVGSLLAQGAPLVQTSGP